MECLACTAWQENNGCFIVAAAHEGLTPPHAYLALSPQHDTFVTKALPVVFWCLV